MTPKYLPKYEDLIKLGLKINRINWQSLVKEDIELINNLARLQNKSSNQQLSSLIKTKYNSKSLQELIDFLKSKNTFDIPIIQKSLNINGSIKRVSIVAATEVDSTSHGDMSSMVYLRDQIQTTGAYMELAQKDPKVHSAEATKGKELLFGALDLLSTPSQLQRFEDIINKDNHGGQADWPQISLLFDDLEGTKPNNWRNKQDAWQMLAYLTFDAIERGFIELSDLADSHKKFLKFTVPFLKAVSFPKYQSSGSWEEIEAVRTSVMAIETALLHKISKFIENSNNNFISKDAVFKSSVEKMIQEGLCEIGQRLPDESPDYDTSSIKFRQADAALVYLLRYDIPKLLADNNIPIAANSNRPLDEIGIENIILNIIKSLEDDETSGIFRYPHDSYQRLNFHTNSIQLAVNVMKQQIKEEATRNNTEVDLDKKQTIRGAIVPVGRMAAWTHPLGQISAWAAKRCLFEMQQNNQTAANHYKTICTQYINKLLGLLTEEGNLTAALDNSGKYAIQKVPPFKLPECYTTYQIDHKKIIVASPHTPLNWSTAMLFEAINLLDICVD